MSRKYLVNFTGEGLEVDKTGILVLGSGVAGLYTSLQLVHLGEVVILTKERLEEGSTIQAQGGIAAVLSSEDSPACHFQDTVVAGDGLCQEEAVLHLVQEGPEQIQQLLEWGLPFDGNERGLFLTREGAHTQDRVVHAGGDATGHLLQKLLMERVEGEPRIQVKEYAQGVDLLVEEGRVLGALYLDIRTRTLKALLAPVVILATGGLGQIYRQTSNPAVATGDGMAMAYRAGLPVMDMEFIQFHPTTLYQPGQENFLISEAVRGEGARLLNRRGERFMESIHPLQDLAPRDIVARAIFQQMQKESSPFLYLDLRPLGKGAMERRFPTIFRYCQQAGIDVEKGLIPITPAAHYSMGGVKINLQGETTIKGLYVCGEAACSGLHGANRLASNSLLEALVFGSRTASHIQKFYPHFQQEISLTGLSYVKQKEGEFSQAEIRKKRKTLQDEVEKGLGIVRSKEDLQQLGEVLAPYRALLGTMFLEPEFLHLQNCITVTLLVLQGARLRQESRGGHYRRDYPQKSPNWRVHLVQSLQGFWKEEIS